MVYFFTFVEVSQVTSKLSESFIGRIELFRDLSPEECLLLQQKAEARSYEPDSLLFTEHSPRKYLFIIEDGEVERLEQNADLFLEVNMGGTAIGTGINADPAYGPKVIEYLREVSGFDVRRAPDLVEATQDTGAFVMYSSALKRLAVKLSKVSNDLRLLSSGPRTGINEINLPAMQPGSSIMPGKVNPVIPEVVNQIAFKVIGNDLTVTLAAEAGQLELNVMEPVIAQSLFESIEMLKNGMTTPQQRCVEGITANEAVCRRQVERSIGLVTALVPRLGYEVCSQLALEALEHDRGVYELVLEKELLSQDELDHLLDPENMVGSVNAG
jgi:aspartate ammonia-lyase